MKNRKGGVTTKALPQASRALRSEKTTTAATALLEPITITLTGHAAATARWLAFVFETTPEKFVLDEITHDIGTRMSDSVFGEGKDCEAWLKEKPRAAKKGGARRA